MTTMHNLHEKAEALIGLHFEPQMLKVIRAYDEARRDRNTDLMEQCVVELADMAGIPLVEGLYDPYILKAVFMAGGPGSGKGFYGEKMFSGMGVKIVNSDNQFERFMKSAGLNMKTDAGTDIAQKELRPKAKRVTTSKLRSLSNNRTGLVIDGTAKDPIKVLRMQKQLESLGYDTSMVLVNTSIDTALERNQMRDRVVPEKIVRMGWEQVQQALRVYKSEFGKDYYEIDGNAVITPDDEKRKLNPAMANMGRKILSMPLKNPVGWAWLLQTVTDLGISDPRKVTHLGKVGMSGAEQRAGIRLSHLRKATVGNTPPGGINASITLDLSSLVESIEEASGKGSYAFLESGRVGVDTQLMSMLFDLTHRGFGDFKTESPIDLPGVGEVTLIFNRIDHTKEGQALQDAGFSGRAHDVTASGPQHDDSRLLGRKMVKPLVKFFKSKGAKLVKASNESIEEGYQHVHFKGSKAVRAKLESGGKRKSVQGRTFDGKLIIHPALGDNYQWSVSHIRTGLSLVPYPYFADDVQAVKFAKVATSRGDWDFDSPEEMTDELKKNMASLLKSFRKHIHMVGQGYRKDTDESIEEKEWSAQVKTKWSPPDGFFTRPAEEIAAGLKEASDSQSQAMSRLVYYINRAGKNLSRMESTRLERAKELLGDFYEGTSITAPPDMSGQPAKDMAAMGATIKKVQTALQSQAESIEEGAFRAPHSSLNRRNQIAKEVLMAEGGVLFLDEIEDWSRQILEQIAITLKGMDNPPKVYYSRNKNTGTDKAFGEKMAILNSKGVIKAMPMTLQKAQSMARSMKESIEEGTKKAQRRIRRAEHKKLLAKAMRSQGTAGPYRGIDPDEYPPIKGLEGPFRFKDGRILYYDPQEGKYYDTKTDMYVFDDDLPESLEEGKVKMFLLQGKEAGAPNFRFIDRESGKWKGLNCANCSSFKSESGSGPAQKGSCKKYGNKCMGMTVCDSHSSAVGRESIEEDTGIPGGGNGTLHPDAAVLRYLGGMTVNTQRVEDISKPVSLEDLSRATYASHLVMEPILDDLRRKGLVNYDDRSAQLTPQGHKVARASVTHFESIEEEGGPDWRKAAKKLLKDSLGAEKRGDSFHASQEGFGYRAYLRAMSKGTPAIHLTKSKDKMIRSGSNRAQEELIDLAGKQESLDEAQGPSAGKNLDYIVDRKNTVTIFDQRTKKEVKIEGDEGKSLANELESAESQNAVSGILSQYTKLLESLDEGRTDAEWDKVLKGNTQKTIVAILMTHGKMPLTQLASHKKLRKVHFMQIQKSAAVLASKGFLKHTTDPREGDVYALKESIEEGYEQIAAEFIGKRIQVNESVVTVGMGPNDNALLRYDDGRQEEVCWTDLTTYMQTRLIEQPSSPSSPSGSGGGATGMGNQPGFSGNATSYGSAGMWNPWTPPIDVGDDGNDHGDGHPFGGVSGTDNDYDKEGSASGEDRRTTINISGGEVNITVNEEEVDIMRGVLTHFREHGRQNATSLSQAIGSPAEEVEAVLQRMESEDLLVTLGGGFYNLPEKEEEQSNPNHLEVDHASIREETFDEGSLQKAMMKIYQALRKGRKVKPPKEVAEILDAPVSKPMSLRSLTKEQLGILTNHLRGHESSETEKVSFSKAQAPDFMRIAKAVGISEDVELHLEGEQFVCEVPAHLAFTLEEAEEVCEV